MTQQEQGGVPARELERLGILKAGTAYRMARAGLIPFRPVGAKLGGIRFNPAEVVEALKELAVKRSAGTAPERVA